MFFIPEQPKAQNANTLNDITDLYTLVENSILSKVSDNKQSVDDVLCDVIKLVQLENDLKTAQEIESHKCLETTSLILVKFSDYLFSKERNDNPKHRFLFVFKDFVSCAILVLAAIIVVAQILVMVQISRENLSLDVCGSFDPPRQIWFAAILWYEYSFNVKI